MASTWKIVLFYFLYFFCFPIFFLLHTRYSEWFFSLLLSSSQIQLFFDACCAFYNKMFQNSQKFIVTHKKLWKRSPRIRLFTWVIVLQKLRKFYAQSISFQSFWEGKVKLVFNTLNDRKCLFNTTLWMRVENICHVYYFLPDSISYLLTAFTVHSKILFRIFEMFFFKFEFHEFLMKNFLFKLISKFLLNKRLKFYQTLIRGLTRKFHWFSWCGYAIHLNIFLIVRPIKVS